MILSQIKRLKELNRKYPIEAARVRSMKPGYSEDEIYKKILIYDLSHQVANLVQNFDEDYQEELASKMAAITILEGISGGLTALMANIDERVAAIAVAEATKTKKNEYDKYRERHK